MPTVSQMIASFKAANRYDEAREHVYQKTGLDFETLPPEADWGAVQAVAKTQALTKPFTDVVETATAGRDLVPRYIDAMGKIGESLAGKTKAPARRRPYFTKPLVQQVAERHPSSTPLEGIADLAYGAATGLAKGAVETGVAYASRAAAPLMLLMGAPLDQVIQDPYASASFKVETPGEKYKREVIDPALEMPVYERAWEGAKGVAGATAMIARAALGAGSQEERRAVGRSLGEGMTSGLAGSFETLATNPYDAIRAQPVETGMLVAGPAARAAGAGIRAVGLAGKAGRLARGAEIVGDFLDPQPGTRRYNAGQVEAFDMSPSQQVEYNQLLRMERDGMLKPGDADRYLDSLKQDYTHRAVRAATEATPASKAGFAARRAAASALLGGDIIGSGASGMLTAAGLGAVAPPLIKGAARRMMTPAQRNRARQFWTDPTAMPDPESEATVIGTTTTPLRQGLGIHDMGVEAGARAAQGRPRPRPAAEGEKPLQWYRETLVAKPGSDTFAAPGPTVGRAMALDEGRMREGAAATAGKFAGDALDAAAKEAAGDANYYRRAKQYVRDRDAAEAKYREAQAAAQKIAKKRQEDPGAFDYEKTRMEAARAREDYLAARGAAELSLLEQEAKALKDTAKFDEWRRLKEEWRGHTEDAAAARKALDDSTKAFRDEVAALAEREVQGKPEAVSTTDRRIQQRDPEGRAQVESSLEGVRADRERFEELVQWRKAAWRRYDEARRAAEEAFGKIEAKTVALVDKQRAAVAAEAQFAKRKAVVSELPEARQREIASSARGISGFAATEAAAAAEAERLGGKAARQRASLLGEESPAAARVLEGVEEGAAQRARAAKAEKLVEDYPRNEAAVKLVSGQVELLGDIFDPRKKDGSKFNRKYIKVIQNEGLQSVIEGTAALVRAATPNSPLADPSYLGQLIATVWQRRALIGAFSARARGYMSKAMVNQMFETVGLDTMRKMLVNYAQNPKAAKWRRGKVEREMRSLLEQKITEVSSKAIMAGKPTEFRLVLEGADGQPVVLDTGTLASKFLKDPNRSMKDRKAVAAEAVSGVFNTIKSHYIRDETRASIAREALRTSNLDPFSVDSRTNGWAAMRSVNEPRTANPNVLLFSPEAFFEQFSDLRSVAANARRWLDDPSIPAGPAGDQIALNKARRAAEFFMREFEEADTDVTKALRAGLAMRDKVLPDGAPVYVRKGYNNAVGTHLRFTQTMENANNLMLDLAEYGKVMMLAGSTSTQVANMFSNVTAISLATGQNPYAVMAGIGREYRKLWTQVERGTLEGFEAKKYRGIMRSGIADSSQLSERFGRLFDTDFDPAIFGDLMNGDLKGALAKLDEFARGGSSKGRTKALTEWYVGLRKEIYKQGDTGPKLFLTSKAFDDIVGSIRNLEPQRYVEMPTGKGSYTRVRRIDYNTYEVGGKRYTLDDQPFIDMIAESAKQFAGDILFDFNDMPGFVKSLMSKKGAFFTYFNPYMAWAFKAAELPGKPGLVGNLLSHDPTWSLKTNSPRLMKDRSKKFAKLAIKRKVQSEAFRQVANLYRSAGMGELIGYDGATDALLVNPFSSELETLDAMDMGSGMPTVMADAALRLATTGGVAAASALAQVMGRTPEQYAAMAESDDPDARAVGKLWQLMASGDIAGRKEAAAFSGLTGGMFNSVMEYLKDDRSSGVSAAQLMIRMMLGGDVQSLINAGAEAYDPGVTWTTRQYLDNVERKENFAKWWFYSMFRMGFRERDFEGRIDKWVEKRKSSMQSAYVTTLKKRARNLEGELSNERKYPRGSEAAAQKERELDAVEAEIDLYETAIEDAGAAFEDAAERARMNWYDRQDRATRERKAQQSLEMRRNMQGAAQDARKQLPLATGAAIDALSTQTR